MKRETRVSGIRRYLNLPASDRTVQRDVDDEIGFHIESRVAELMAAGTPRAAARDIAAREFGDVSQARSEIARVDKRRLTRERRQAWWETLGQDLSYSVRSLRSQPGFSAVTIIVLALGIGANVTMFGIVDRLLLRPPAYVVDPRRVVSIGTTRPSDAPDDVQNVLSYPIYQDMQRATDAFEQVAVYANTDLAIGRGRDARSLRGLRVSANYFSLLGVRPALGRFFLPEEDGDPIAPHVVVLGSAFWKTEFDGKRSVIGQTMTIGDDPYTIVGVAPEGFTGVRPGIIDAWVPATSNITAKTYQNWTKSRQSYWLFSIARLRAGTTLARAEAVATTALRAGDREDRDSAVERGKERNVRLVSVLPRDAQRGSADAKVAVLLAAVSVLVLLIACANVANLQLARALARSREVAVRVALGIDRGRLVRQLVAETVLLALAAGVAAVLVTIWGGGIIRRVVLTSEIAASSAVDLRLVAYTAFAAVAAGVLSGLIPAIQSSRPDLAISLRAGARAGGPARSQTRSILLVVQAALTVVFLVGTMLFMRSLERVQGIPLGLEPSRVLVVTARTSGAHYTSTEIASLYDRLEAAARSAPGVESAALSVGLPFSTSWAERVSIPGRDSVPLTSEGGPYFNAVTPDFFRTMGTRLVRGRGFSDAERTSAARVVVINQTIARMWWPNEDPIGQCMRVGDDTMPCAQVVGIAEDARRQSVIEDPAIQFFMPLPQSPVWATSRVMFIRPRGDAAHAVEAIRRVLQDKLPDAPYLEVRPLEDLVSPQMRAWRLGATMFGAFGLLAVVVAALGLYSVLAYDVSRRFRELGIRVALGAARTDIGRMVVGRAIRVAAVGATIGFAIAIAAGPTVSPLLFQTSARDPAAFGLAAAIRFAVALLAAIIPTRRAASVDPIITLRSD
jgi:predicted permease